MQEAQPGEPEDGEEESAEDELADEFAYYMQTRYIEDG